MKKKVRISPYIKGNIHTYRTVFQVLLSWHHIGEDHKNKIQIEKQEQRTIPRKISRNGWGIHYWKSETTNMKKELSVRKSVTMPSDSTFFISPTCCVTYLFFLTYCAAPIFCMIYHAHFAWPLLFQCSFCMMTNQSLVKLNQFCWWYCIFYCPS